MVSVCLCTIFILLFFLKVGPFDEKRFTKRSYHFFTEYHIIFIARLSWIMDNHMNFQYQFGIPGIPGMDSRPMAKPDKVVLEVEILGRRSISISSRSDTRWLGNPRTEWAFKWKNQRTKWGNFHCCVIVFDYQRVPQKLTNWILTTRGPQPR